MNSAFVGYEEFSRSRRVLSTEAEASEDNTLRDLLNSSYPTKAEFINCFIIHQNNSQFKNIAKTSLPASMLSSSSLLYV